MPHLTSQLELARCPHCGVSSPNLTAHTTFQTSSKTGEGPRQWKVYICQRCGGAVLAWARPNSKGGVVQDMYPTAQTVDESIPSPASDYLAQALESLHAPAGSIMLSASSVDAMLKSKGLSSGSLYSRIDKAAEQHLITEGMAKWAHEVRLDANDQRHADENAALPTGKDAERVVEFVLALGQFLFVLPSRVQRGIDDAQETDSA